MPHTVVVVDVIVIIDIKTINLSGGGNCNNIYCVLNKIDTHKQLLSCPVSGYFKFTYICPILPCRINMNTFRVKEYLKL